jgi:hypothetical protein
VWQPTPPAYNPAVQAGQGRARPFVLDRADRFRATPPPALTSPQYARDFNEVKAFGRTDSAVRSAWQTNVGLLWKPANLANWSQLVRQVLAQSHAPLRDQVRLVATFHAVTADAYIAGFETKYRYVSWRPVTAIRAAGTDGNPATEPDPAWSPLFATPDHPEYISGHNVYSGAAIAVLTAFTGSAPSTPVTLTVPDAPGFVRTYTSWAEVGQDVKDTRVWAGLHFRFSENAGYTQGAEVARYDLRRLTW